MSSKLTETTIEILGKTYLIKCPDSEIDSLQETAHYLEEKMRQVQNSGVTSQDKIAVIAALNVTHQFLNFEKGHLQNINQRLYDLQKKVEHALESDEVDV